MSNSNNVYFNNRTAVHKASQGILTTVSINLTGHHRVPIPYTNIAYSKDAENTANNVFINGENVCHIKSSFSKSMGDEAGNHGGIISRTINGKAEFITGSHNIFVNGLRVARQYDLMVSNNKNTQPSPLMQPGKGNINERKNHHKDNKEQKRSNYYYDFRVSKTLDRTRNVCFALIDKKNNIVATTPINFNHEIQKFNQLNNKKSYSLILLITQSDEKEIKIPLLENIPIYQANKDEKKLETILIPVKLKWQCNKEEKKYVKNKQWNDIIRLPEWLRRKIYPTITSYKESWFEQLSINLQNSIERYLSPDKSVSLRSGWIYIYNHGYLWRELFINKNGLYKEVDLERFAGESIRPATGKENNFIILPYKINNIKSSLEITFSEIQWSWARINYFGGMSTDDQRIINNNHYLFSFFKHGLAEQHRKSRFDSLMIDECFNHVKNNTFSVHPNKSNLLFNSKRCFYSLLISDPLGWLIHALNDLSDTWFELINAINATKNPKTNPYFQSALLCYQVFFNPMNAKNQGLSEDETYQQLSQLPVDAPELEMTWRALENPNLFKRNQKNLNKDLLEKILNVKKRRKLREKIRILQKIIVDILNNKMEPKKISIESALTDLFTCDDILYEAGYMSISGILSLIKNDPHNLDFFLDVYHENDWEEITEGQQYIISIFNPTSSMYKMMFPPSSNEILHSGRSPNIGDGLFRPDVFKRAFQKISHEGKEEIEHNAVDFFDYAIKHIIEAGITAWKKGEDNKIIPIQNTIVNLLHATDNDLLKKINALPIDVIKSEEAIIGFAINKQYSSDQLNHLKKGIPVYTYLEKNQMNYNQQFTNPIYISKNAYKHFRFVKNPKQQYTNIYESFKKLYRSDKKIHFFVLSSKSLLKKPLEYLHRANTIILSTLSLFNIEAAIEAFNDPEKSKLHQSAEVSEAVFGFLYSFENVILSFVSEEEFDAWQIKYSKLAKKTLESTHRFGFRFNPLSTFGVISSTIGTLISFSDMLQSIHQNNLGVFLGELILTGSGTLGTLSFFGISARRALSLQNSTVEKIVPQTTKNKYFAELLELSPLFEEFELSVILLNIIGFILTELFRNDDITLWAKKNPFSLKPKSMTPQETYLSLLNLLISPTILITSKETNQENIHLIIVEVRFPYIPKEQTSIDIRCTAQKQSAESYFSEKMRIELKPQKELIPFKIEQIKRNQYTTLSIRYYYHLKIEPLKSINHHRGVSYTLYAKTKISFNSKNASIPFVLNKPQKVDDHIIEDKEADPSWVYAKPHIIFPKALRYH